jgi:hypothetical protein
MTPDEAQRIGQTFIPAPAGGYVEVRYDSKGPTDTYPLVGWTLNPNANNSVDPNPSAAPLLSDFYEAVWFGIWGLDCETELWETDPSATLSVHLPGPSRSNKTMT